MNNATRKELLQKHKQSGFPGSIIDVFKAYDQGIDLIGQYMQQQQQQMQVANTPQQQEQGLRPQHQAGNTQASMAFPNTPPNASFNTVGMKAPIDMNQYDDFGNLVASYNAVPPGIKNLTMSSKGGTVIETPTQMKSGGVRKYQLAGPRIDGPRVPAMSDAEMSLKIIQEANAGNPAARRMRSDYGQRMFLPGEAYPSTHYMASFDNYAVPTVQEDYIGGPLSYRPNPAPSKADFRFDTPEQAAYFAKNYKQASAAKTFQQKSEGVRKYQLAGPIDNTAVATPPSPQYQLNPLPQTPYRDQGTIRPVPRSLDYETWRDDDSLLENALEFIDPTGITSWDDARRAYNSMQERGASYPNFDEALDMFGALPLVGKFKKGINLGKGAAKHIGDIKNFGASAYNALTRGADVINRVDAIEDETGFLDSKKTGGIRKAQNGLPPLTLGQTSPDWKATGPGLRIDGQTYQNSQLTGATRIPLNPETGDQLPIMLPAAEVVGRRNYNDSIQEAISRTNSGLLGSQVSAQNYAQMENAVRSGMNTAGNNMLAAAGDILSSPQRYAVNAPLAYAMGKTPNLSMFPSADRNLGINQPNAFPSETLGVTNPIGAFAVDALTDPTAIAGIGALGKAGISRAKGLLRNAAGDVNQTLLSRSLPSAIEQTPQRQAARSQEWMQNWFNNPETQRRIDRLVPENAQMSSGTQNVRGHMKGFGQDVTLIDDETRTILNAENVAMNRNNPGYSSVHYPQHRVEGSIAFPNQTVLDPKQINNLESATIHELTHSAAPSEFINAATTSTTLGRTSTSPGVKGTDIFRRHLTPQAKSAEDLYQQGIRNTGWADAGYMSDPTEQHARIMQLRHMGNLKPGQQVTASTIENLRNQNFRALGSGKEVVEDQFFDIYSSPARMADMFNTLPGLAPIAGGALTTGVGIGLLNNNTAVSPQMRTGGIRKLKRKIR